MESRSEATARILVIDDDESHAASVSGLLKAYGYGVDRETDGVRGIERIRSAPIDVLILDLDMPRMSGTEVLSQLGPDTARVKTIVLSGASDLREVTPILRLGAYDYLPKPYEPEQLLSSVRNAVTRVRLERENAAMAAAREADDRRYAFLVNASPDLIYMLDARGRVTFHNERLKDLIGPQAAAALGSHWKDVAPALLHPTLEHRIDERRTGERATRNLEFVFDDGQGTLRILELSALGLYEGGPPAAGRFAGTYGVLRDVTAHRRAARALAQSQQKFQALFVNSPDAVFISALDDGSLLEGNDNFTRIMRELGTDRVENDVSVWGERGARDAFVAKLRAAPERCTAELVRHLGATDRHFEITARLLELDDRTCIVASLRDLTSQRLAEQDRLNLETQLQQASKMEAIGQLAGGIAHDFNNILASIIGYTELALAAPKSADGHQVKSYLAEVVTAGQRARDLISQMLTFTRARRGTPVATDVRQSIEDVSRMLRAAIPKTIDIRTEFADAPAILVDPVQLQQVVINLLINSRDAITGNGRIVVGVRGGPAAGRCAACDATLSGDYLELAVADTGHGIPADMLPRIFDMFVSTREPGRGTGIGLWLVNTIVHEYGGHLTIETSPRGTIFHVYLPPAAAVAQAPTPAAEPFARPALSGHIVVIDDEVTVGNFIGEALRNAGYEAIVFNDATAAMAHLDRRADDVALILTDQSMPQLSGLDVAEAAKARNPTLPVVIVTGYADKTDRSRMARLGIDRLLTKPFRIDTLLAAVRDLTAAPAAPG